MRGPKHKRVSPITLADRARDAEQWEIAVKHYTAALARNPCNAPIWVQFGNALKESGRHVWAEGAYRKALEDDPTAADTYVQLGHVLKLQGRHEEANQSYLRALVLEPLLDSARLEVNEQDRDESRLARLREALA